MEINILIWHLAFLTFHNMKLQNSCFGNESMLDVKMTSKISFGRNEKEYYNLSVHGHYGSGHHKVEWVEIAGNVYGSKKWSMKLCVLVAI